MLAEHVENLFYRATLFTPGIELAIRVGSCSTLTKAVVALAVDLLCLSYLREVLLTFADILATFQHNGAQAKFYQAQSSKQAARPRTHDDDLRTTGNIGIAGMHVLILLRLLVDIATHLQIDVNSTLTGIDTATQNAHSRQRTDIEAVLVSQIAAQSLLVGSHMGLYTDLVFVSHFSPSKRSLISSISSSSNHFDKRFLAFT